jgi:hypothetical protein
MLYNKANLDPQEGCDGSFATYTTIDTQTIDNDNIALGILRKCAHAVHSLMQRRVWQIRAFHELPFDSEDWGSLRRILITEARTGKYLITEYE